MLKDLQSETVTDLTAALAKAQGMMTAASKDATNSHFKNKYADLASIFEVVRQPFATHGISYTQQNEQLMNGQWLVWTVLRKGAEWIANPTPILMRGQNSQDFGAAETYARRQGMQTLCGIAADEDDDGETASGRGKKQAGGEGPKTTGNGPKPGGVGPKPKTETESKDPNAVTEAQLARMFAIAKEKGWTTDQVKSYLKDGYGLESSKLLTKRDYDDFCKMLAEGYQNAVALLQNERQAEPGTQG